MSTLCLVVFELTYILVGVNELVVFNIVKSLSVSEMNFNTT